MTTEKRLSCPATGGFIREKRTELNLTQEELALKLGITKNAISNWENGSTLIDSKYLVALSNIFSVEIDDILFPNTHPKSERPYSDISTQFVKMAHFEITDSKLCKKLLDLFVDCRILIIDLMKQYKSTQDEKLLTQILQENKFAFGFLEEYKIIDRNSIKNILAKNLCIEDQLETMWSPFLYSSQSYAKEQGEKGAHISRLFLDEWYICDYIKTKDGRGHTMSSNIAMANFIFDFGGERIFRKFISSFSQEYRNNLLLYFVYFIEKTRKPAIPTHQERKAMKYLLRAGAELWVDGENQTNKLMLCVFN